MVVSRPTPRLIRTGSKFLHLGIEKLRKMVYEIDDLRDLFAGKKFDVALEKYVSCPAVLAVVISGLIHRN